MSNKHGRISGWIHVFDHANAAGQTAADLYVADHISADVALAQGEQSAFNDNDRVQTAAGQVHAQATLVQMQLDKQTGEAAELQTTVSFWIKKFQDATAAGNTADAAKAKQQGGQASAALAAKKAQIATTQGMLDNMNAQVEAADNAAAASDQQLADAKDLAADLRNKKVLASMATASSEAISNLTNPNPDNIRATMADAESKINQQYAQAIGHQAVVNNSAAAQQIAAQVEMHQAAGADLFDQAVAAASTSAPQPATATA